MSRCLPYPHDTLRSCNWQELSLSLGQLTLIERQTESTGKEMKGDIVAVAGLGRGVHGLRLPDFNFLPFRRSSYIVVMISRVERFKITMALTSGVFLPPFPKGGGT